MKKLMNYRSVAGLGVAVALAVSAPAFAANTPAEAANKQVVLDFYAALNAADAAGSTKQQIPAIADKFLSPEYKQNTIIIPGPGTDREKLIKMFQSMPAMPAGAKPGPQRTDAIMAEGDKVMMLTSRPQVDPATGAEKRSYIFNMFRVKDGKLVEHWDVSSGGGAPPPGAGGPPGGPGGPPPGPQ